MVRSVTRDLPEQGKNNPAVNQAAGNGGQKMGQYSWFTVYVGTLCYCGIYRLYTILLSAMEYWFDSYDEIDKNPLTLLDILTNFKYNRIS